jgi:hypothetical protein
MHVKIFLFMFSTLLTYIFSMIVMGPFFIHVFCNSKELLHLFLHWVDACVV